MSREALTETMGRQHLAPLWELYQNLVTKEPAASEPSQIWHWQELLPTIERTATEITGEAADHRVLLLKNPGLGGRIATSTNMIAGVQCVLPGEKTVEHRHTASACRLILDGKGGSTFVDGKRCRMHDNDFIVTPNWTWHGHENDSNARAVWLDMLDVPLMKTFDANFGGRGPANEYPNSVGTMSDTAFAGGGLVPMTSRSTVTYSPRFRWGWDEVMAALTAMPAEADGTRLLRYTNPLDGGPVMATLDASVLELAGDVETAPFRSTANALCVVLEGEGQSHIGDATHRWSRHDIFTLPHWQWITHKASGGAARLLLVTDREVLRRLDLLREEAGA